MINMSNRLDRHFNLFGHMGNSAYSEGMARIRKKEIQDIADELDAKTENIQRLKQRNRQLVDQINHEIDDFNELRLECIEYVKQRDGLSQQLAQANQKIQELEQRYRSATNSHISTVKEQGNLVDGLDATVNDMEAEMHQAESVFVNMMTSKNLEDFKKRASLKVALCQIKAYSAFVKDLMEKGLAKQSDLDAYMQMQIEHQDKEDAQRNGITYKETVEWLNTNFRSMARILNILKK